MAWAPSKVPQLYIKIRIFFVFSVEHEGRPSMRSVLLLGVGESAYWANGSVRKKGTTLRQRGKWPEGIEL